MRIVMCCLTLQAWTQAFVVLAVMHTSAFGAVDPAPAYDEVLGLSISFFEFQISGTPPSWSKGVVDGWRGAAHTDDGKTASVTYDLAGGWYTDGGHLKSTLTTATSLSLLAYGALYWENALVADGEWDTLVRNAAWAADYLVKCRVASNTYVAQVGDHFQEELYWGAPEDHTISLIKYNKGWRPVWTINTARRYEGGDVVSQAAAALTGVAMLLNKPGGYQNAARAAELNTLADSLWEDAKNMRAVWKVPEGNRTVYSRTYSDDQTWAAAWMCKREIEAGTSGGPLCTEALTFFDAMTLREGSLTTDNMHAMAITLLLNLGAGGSSYIADYLTDLQTRFLAPWAAKVEAALGGDSSAKCTACDQTSYPCALTDGDFAGLVLGEGKGTLQYTVGMSAVALAVAGDSNAASVDAATRKKWQCYAKSQIDIILGQNAQSQAFVSGINTLAKFSSIMPVNNPRHRGSSCNGKGQPCATLGEDNPNTLVGALVGGPEPDGTFTDSRIAEPDTLVSIEFNAPFTMALLGLSSLKSQLSASGTTLDAYCA